MRAESLAGREKVDVAPIPAARATSCTCPLTSTRPAPMTVMTVASSSTSGREWLVSSMAAPSSASSRTRSRTCNALSGSDPVVGSSSGNSGGRPSSALAT